MIEVAVGRAVAGAMDNHLEHCPVFPMAKEHRKTLYGNGKDGLTVRVDRLEQTRSTFDWLWKAGVVALLTSSSTLLAARFLPQLFG